MRGSNLLMRAGLALASAIVGGIALISSPTDARATCRDRNFIDGLNLIQASVNTVRVTGSNDTYDHIEPVSFTGDIRINLCNDGALDGVIVHFGACSGHNFGGCNSNPIMHLEFPSARDFHKMREFPPFSIPPDSSTGQSILQKCNAVADGQKGAGGDRNVDPESFFVTLGVDTRREPGGLGDSWGVRSPAGVVHGIVEPDGFRPIDEYSKTFPVLFTVNVACAPLPQPIKAPPKPVAVNISVDPKGEVCPKETEVTTWIYYEEPAVAQFRFKLDGELSGLYTREAIKVGGHQGPGPKGKGREDRYLVKETKTYYLDPGQHHFRVEVRGGAKSEVITRRTECPPFKVTSAWLTYRVEDKPTCPKEVDEKATFKSTRPGKAPFEIKTQGGLVVHSGTAEFERKGKAYIATVKRDLVLNAFDQDMMALIKNDLAANSGWTRLKVECTEVLSGTLDLREFAATRCEGEAALSIRTNMPGEVPYQLDCTGAGRSWSGTVQSQQTGPNTYLGVDVKRFDVSNNDQVNCALKTREPFPVKVLALKGNKYECHKPSGASGTSDLTPPGRPDDPPPVRDALKGDFTFLDNSGPRCPRKGWAIINFLTDTQANVHYSLDCTNGSFSGVAKAVPAPKGGYIAPASVSFDIEKTTQANCALKSVAPGKPEVHTLKGHLFQCITPTGVPGTSDYTPPTRPDPQSPGIPPKVVVDPPRTPPSGATGEKISCAGGAVKNGQCTCERTHRAVQAGPNAWRCVQIAVVDPLRITPGATGTAQKISCAGGSVRNGKCVCASGFNAVVAGANAFRCVKIVTFQTPAPKIATPSGPTPAIKGCPAGQKRVNGKCIRPAG
jgi:hypothetical protein